MLLLLSSDIERLVAHHGLNDFMDKMISDLEIVLKVYDTRIVDIPPRAGFVQNGLIEWMPVHFFDRSVVIKVVGYFPSNPRSNGAPTIQAHISRSNWADGTLTELVEGSLLTAVRTGAASAIASRALAHPDSRTLGLVGCGTQAVTQAHAISRCFKIDRILGYDVDRDAHRSIAARLAFLGIPVQAAMLHEVESRADILCTATSVAVGAGPVIAGTHLKPHVHINAVGSDFPGKIELPAAVLSGALVVPDHRAQAMKEGECQTLPAEAIGPELHELVRDAASFAPFRTRRTVFDSTGFALEDAVALDLACRLADAAGIGTRMPFTSDGRDPKNPYAACITTDLAALRALATTAARG